MLAAYRELRTKAKVAAQMGLDCRTVRKILRSLGVSEQGPERAICEMHTERLLKMNQENCTLSEMAKAIGVQRWTVSDFLRARGETREFPRGASGEYNPRWAGGRMVSDRGYIRVLARGHPNQMARGHMLEHRLVMEAHLGRFLEKDEVIHHLDGNPSNNTLENLQLFPNHSEHMKFEQSLRKAGRTKRGRRCSQRPSRPPKPPAQKPTPAESGADAPSCI